MFTLLVIVVSAVLGSWACIRLTVWLEKVAAEYAARPTDDDDV